MADPFAPPSDSPRPRRATPARADWAQEPDPVPYAPAVPAASGPTPQPAHPGPFWVVVAVGVGLLALGALIQFFTIVGDVDGEDIAPLLFATFGAIAVSIGFALAAVLQRGLPLAIRAALLIAGAYFATGAGSFALISGFGRFL